ncbi:unnamed protein product [Moneuplotes crassus]|uniref:Alpha/beta hydrolase fold-3 domain-containing protein n=1 Tax=Euplotes crassus TaxID=5936 RepID=A0AAD1Y762_EUPCR|nr:unnamed protein product [Moneuplotes crassus]
MELLDLQILDDFNKANEKAEKTVEELFKEEIERTERVTERFYKSLDELMDCKEYIENKELVGAGFEEIRIIVDEQFGAIQNIKKNFYNSQEETKEQEAHDYNISAIGQMLYLMNGVLALLANAMDLFMNQKKEGAGSDENLVAISESPSDSPGQTLDKDEALVDIMYLSALVKYSPELFTMALESSNYDFLCDRTLPEWKEIRKIHKIVNFDKSDKFGKETVRESNQAFIGWLLYVKATLSQQNTSSNKLSKFFKTMTYGTFYMFSVEKCRKQCKLSLSKDTVEEARQILNLLDDKYVSFATKISHKSIKFHKLLFVPKTENDFESILQASEGDMPSYSEYCSQDNRQIPVDDCDPEQTKFHMDIDNFDPETHVQVRLLCNCELPYNFEKKQVMKVSDFQTSSFQKSFACLSCIGSREPYNNFPEVDEIVVHIHGGGFVGMSSNGYQNITRKWASRINIPIFSIDYGCAPEHPYPKGLEDCWQAYRWIVLHSKTHLGISPNKIILVGDSAGGNFCCGVTILAIQNNFRVPDCLILPYPAVDLSVKRFYPSYIYGINDFMLNLIMLKIYQGAYLTEEIDGENNPLLSPIQASDNVLERFPKVRILVGSCDPLRDQSFRFVDRLLKVSGNVKIVEYVNYPHAFLNFQSPVCSLKGSGIANKQICTWIEDAILANRIDKRKGREKTKF